MVSVAKYTTFSFSSMILIYIAMVSVILIVIASTLKLKHNAILQANKIMLVAQSPAYLGANNIYLTSVYLSMIY